MSKRIMSDSALLDRLSAALRRPGMPSQAAISDAAGVDQPLVSRARRGQLKRVTPRVRRLYEYAETRIAEVDDLTASRQRQARRQPSIASEALSDCKAYLDDGCDPSLLRDQIVVLRRAQGVARRSR